MTLCSLLFAILPASTGEAGGATTTLLSESINGGAANSSSYCGDISTDGRIVLMSSSATDLVPQEVSQGFDHVFVRDAVAGTTEQIDVSSRGGQPNGQNGGAALSGSGRYVAFQSGATNLARDTNFYDDIFLRDRVKGRTTIVDRNSSGDQVNDIAFNPAISMTGRFVGFASDATNIDPRATNRNRSQIYLRDRQSGTTLLVSVGSAGRIGNGNSYDPSISADGRYVAFYSVASNLVKGDTNGLSDVFVHDLSTGKTVRASVATSGAQADDVSAYPSISSNGSRVAFTSHATNLVPGDTNGQYDGFVRDLATNTTTRVTVSSSGEQANDGGVAPSISPDGRFVGVSSQSTNLVPGDTSGIGEAFVYDLATGRIRLVSRSSSGALANADTGVGGISANATYACISSPADNLVPNDTNEQSDGFLRGPLSYPG